MRRFFSERLPNPNEMVLLKEEVSHHLLRVVGIAPGEEVELFDGEGNACVAYLSFVKEGRALMKWRQELEKDLSLPEIWVGLALTKKDAFATALRMLTEIGVAHIVPIQSARSVAKGDKSERWNKIVRGAAGQSKQAKIPKIHPLNLWGSGLDLLADIPNRWILHPVESEGRLMKAVEKTAILIGPEGGFTEKEVAKAVKRGWRTASLSPNVLRADTAAIVAVSQLLARY